MADADLAELEIAIDGIHEMTAKLEYLRRARRAYAGAFGPGAEHETFRELDKALKALRKAAR